MLAQQAAEVCPTRSIGNESRQRWRKHHPVEVAPGVWRPAGELGRIDPDASSRRPSGRRRPEQQDGLRQLDAANIDRRGAGERRRQCSAPAGLAEDAGAKDRVAV